MASVHHHEWRLRAPPERLWPYVADTQRLNAALGLPAWDFVDEKTSEGMKRTGSMSYMGMDISWDEKPYEWLEGRELSVERVFTNGPLAWYRSHVRLEPAGEGTRLRHSLEFEPRVRALALVGHFELGVKLRRNLERAYGQIDAFLAGEAKAPYSTRVRTILPPGAIRLDEALRRLTLADGFERSLAERLVELLYTGDDTTLVRLRPLELADRWGLDRGLVLGLFVRAAARGILVLGWDVICPSCRGPRLRVDELRRLETEAHCSSCDVKIDTRAERALELVFSVSPAIVAVEAKVHCKGSPRNTPHVVLQRRLAPGSSFHETFVLAPGTYRIRGSGVAKPSFLTVRADLPPSGVSLLVSGDGVFPWEVSTGTAIELQVNNDAELERVLVLESASWHDDAVTTARAFACEEFLAAFPGELPPPSFALTAGRLAVVAMWTDAERATEHLDQDEKVTVSRLLDVRLAEEARRKGGAVVRADAGRLLAFAVLEDALDAASALGTAVTRFEIERRIVLAPRFGVAASPCSIVASPTDKALIQGAAVSDARALLGIAAPGDVLLDAVLFEESRLKDGERFDHSGRALVRRRFPPPSIEVAPGPVALEDLELGQKLGAGGTAVVFEARHRHDGRRFAVKFVTGRDARARARFTRELEAFFRIHGVPGVVSVHGYGDRGGDFWIALDLVEGISLDRQRAELGRFAAARAASVLAPVARALHAAHERGVLHRDVKPANIIVDPAGKPWLVDFGIAKLEHAQEAEWTPSGTLGYMPPEALDPKAVLDARADVYSLGATLFELLAGVPLFEAATRAESIIKIVTESPPEIGPGATGPAGAIVRHALRKNPEDRYKNAAEIAQDLELVARGEAPVFAPEVRSGLGATKQFKTTLFRRAMDILKGEKEE